MKNPSQIEKNNCQNNDLNKLSQSELAVKVNSTAKPLAQTQLIVLSSKLRININ